MVVFLADMEIESRPELDEEALLFVVTKEMLSRLSSKGAVDF